MLNYPVYCIKGSITQYYDLFNFIWNIVSKQNSLYMKKMYSHFSNKHTLIYNLNFINFILVQENGSQVKIPGFALAPNCQINKK